MLCCRLKGGICPRASINTSLSDTNSAAGSSGSPGRFISMSGEEQLVGSCRIESPPLSLRLPRLHSCSTSVFFPSLLPPPPVSPASSNHPHLNSYSAWSETRLAHTQSKHSQTLHPALISSPCLFILFSFAATLIKS